MSRVETGSIQFGDDWPACVIRGDSAGWFALHLSEALEKMEDGSGFGTKMVLTNLLKALAGSNTHMDQSGTQMMKPFEECVLPTPPTE